MKHIIILGGSYAGVGTAHRLFKQAGKNQSFRITMVTPNTHFYWNIASPRGIIPGEFDDEKLFQPIEAGFKQYAPTRFAFILGSAESLDVDSNTVSISSPDGSNQTLVYDFLIIATGSRTHDRVPFKGLESTEATKDALHDFQVQVTKAKKIVVAGGGVTGVEVAGELGFSYGKEKDIILVASSPKILAHGKIPGSVSKTAAQALQHLKVDIMLNTSVVAATKMPNGQQELTLSGGEQLITDMYIPTYGLIPNSSYIPSKFLDKDAFVMVDDHLAVKGTKNIWAIGDVSDTEFPQYLSTERQSKYLAKAMSLFLRDMPVQPYKAMTARACGFQIGKYTATGHYGDMKIPGFIVAYMRKGLFTHMLEGLVQGTSF